MNTVETNFILEKNSVYGKIYIDQKTGERALLKTFEEDKFSASNIDDAILRLSRHQNSQKIIRFSIVNKTVNVLYKYEPGTFSLRKFFNFFSTIHQHIDEIEKTKIQFVKAVAFQMMNYLAYVHYSGGRDFHGSLTMDNIYVTAEGILLIEPSMTNEFRHDTRECGKILSALIGKTNDHRVSMIVGILGYIGDPVQVIDSMIRFSEPYRQIDFDGSRIIARKGETPHGRPVTLWKPQYSWNQINDPWSIEMKGGDLRKYRTYLLGVLKTGNEKYFETNKADNSSAVMALKRSSKFFNYLAAPDLMYEM